MQDTLEEQIKKLIAGGATDDDIRLFIQQRKSTAPSTPAPTVTTTPTPQESGAFSRFFKGVGRGAKEETQDIVDIAGGVLGGPANLANSMFRVGTRAATKPKLEEGDTAGRAGEIVGSIIPSIPLSMATAGLVNPIVTPAASRLLGPAAKTIAKTFAKRQAMQHAIEVGITTIPQEMVGSVIVEAAMNPESFRDSKSIIKTAALGSIGSLVNTGLAYREAIRFAKSAKEVDTILQQVKELNDEIADVGRVMPNAPAPTAGAVTSVDGPIPSQLDVAQGRAQMDAVPGSGQMPTARQRAWARVWPELEAEAQRRIEALQNIKPTQPVDRIARAASQQQADPLIRAQVAGVMDRMLEINQNRIRSPFGIQDPLEIISSGGKGVQTPAGVDLGVRTTPNQFLTLEELQDHLQILNMASVMSTPKTQPGQRIITPRGGLLSAEEIAARATGGPIKRIDPAVEKGLKDVQARLDAAAASNLKMLDPGEEADIVNEMLAMSRRLSRGFEVPRAANTPLPGTARKDVARKAFGEDITDNISTSAALEDPNINTKIEDDSFKRWVTSSDVEPPQPNVLFTDRRAGGNVPPVPPAGPVAASSPLPDPIIGQEIATTYADAVRNANIDYSPKVKGTFTRFVERLRDIKTEFYDRTWGVGKYDELTRDNLSLLGGVSHQADMMFSEQVSIPKLDDAGKWRGESVPIQATPIGKAIDSMKIDEIKEADAYLKALTIRDSMTKNPKFISDMSPQQINAILENAPQKIRDFAVEFKKTADALIDDSVLLGRMSASRAADLKQNFYAGLSRSMNNPVTQKAFLQRTGSKKASLSPIQLMRDHIFKTLESNRRNYAFNNLIDSYEQNPLKFSGIIEPIQVNKSKIPGFAETVKDLQENAGLTLREAEDLAMLNQPSLDLSDGTLVVYRKGAPTFWKVNEDIRKTMDALSPVEFGLFKSFMTAISAPTRTGVSLALDLSLLGPASDALLTSANVPKFNPLVDPIRGFWHSAIKSPEYLERAAAGGAYGGRFEPSEVVVFKNSGAATVKKVVDRAMHPLKMLQTLIRPLSDASRMGEYLVRRQKLGQDAMTAALGSRRTLGDFNRVGASLRTWALITEFGNVGIQSSTAAANMLRTATKEAAKGNMKPALRMMSVGVGAVTIPTIYLRALAEQDPELNAKRKGDTGYANWWFRAPVDIPGVADEGDILKIPKPGWWFGQVFGSSIEAALDGMGEDERKKFLTSFTNQLGFNMMPLKAQQLFGLMTNTRNPLSPFTPNYPITPQSQQNLDPIVQGNERTSPLARTLADNVGMNPFVTDFMTEVVGGGLLSSTVRQLGRSDVVLEKADMPVVGRFFARKGGSSEGSDMFYRDLERAKKADISFQKAAKGGDPEKTAKIMEEYSDVLGKRQMLESFGTQIAGINNMMNTIVMDPSMSPEGKREFLNNLRDTQNQLFMAYADMMKGR